MPFAARYRNDQTSPLEPLSGFVVRRETDATTMAALQNRTVEEMALLTPCWRCARAGRANMTCAEGSCHCDYQRPEADCAV